MCILNTYVSHNHRGYYVLYQIWRDAWDVAIGIGGGRYWNERGHKWGTKLLIDTRLEECISVLPAGTSALILFLEQRKLTLYRSWHISLCRNNMSRNFCHRIWTHVKHLEQRLWALRWNSCGSWWESRSSAGTSGLGTCSLCLQKAKKHFFLNQHCLTNFLRTIISNLVSIWNEQFIWNSCVTY